ncbi:uncharacterized protein NECHADRAFT_122482 [Fusarium vanettenii 77-13-4]|uniref:Uncharacterized protein n=1 Tax=Fusarium vanettenii (strain ATCC MYA-4622 / CBS 123669 / FGSC 9596 / NRRL 45880 / 77-13-4) TaxID=660122 RepID=C7YPQ5_FUSV7|nr:uncharacterized protein NECHADRAFT_122482 [Fusarium vanettenii 77-13-4]EEU46332.1 hypothetical protein NECHADRAFT_122482 [Fusarium vanettenii 77-13-4]
MLTVKQPPTYGYKSVHDLPTPPSTSRPSPPLIYQEPATKSLPVAHRSHSPPSQPMSAPHRGLPPPAAMTLPPQQPPAGVAPPPAHHAPPPPPPPPPALAPPSHQQRDSWGQLPAPPQQWQGAEESMKHWLQARAEEDKRRQEEERTRQESLRLEQRKVEMDMLRTSLSGGIPPPMVPLVFTGMASGGIMPQAALEWAQQFMPPSQVPRAQIMPAGWPVSPEHQRESQAHAQAQQAHAQHHGLPPAPAPPATGYAYPGSPTRQRGQTHYRASTQTFLSPRMVLLRGCTRTRTCTKPNNNSSSSSSSSTSLSRAPRYTSITGNRRHRKPAAARTGPEALPGRLPESARPRGSTNLLHLPPVSSNDFDPRRPPFLRAALLIRHLGEEDGGIHGKEATCRRFEA